MSPFFTPLTRLRAWFVAALLAGVSATAFGQEAERAPKAPAIQQEGHRAFPLHTLRADGPAFNLQLPQDFNQTEAQWDIQFNYNLPAATSAPVVAFAGVVHTGTEFWVSSWRSDTIFRLNSDGTLIARVTTLFRANGVPLRQIRGLTWDGTSIWACNVTNTLFKIDPTTRTVIDSLTFQGAVAARFAAYDPNVNGGAGGFHVGNFTSAYNTVSMTGALLQSVPASAHGVVGVYGGVVDTISAAGPYLWVFAQDAPNDNQFKALRLPGMIPTALQRDAYADFPLTVNAVAGGAFIASGIVPNKNTLGGIIQDSPGRLIGYELDVVPISVDASLSAIAPTSRLTQVPFDQLTPLSFSGTVFNGGIQALTAVKAKTELIDLNTFNTVFSDSSTLANVASGASVNFTTAPYTVPNIGDFAYITYLNTGAQQDQVLSNDTLAGFFFTDSTFARDNGRIAGRLGFGNNTGGIIGQTFTTTVVRKLTTVSVAFLFPPIGQSVTSYIYTMGSGTNPTPAAPVFTSNTYTFTPADTGVVLVDFVFENAFLPPSNWFFGVDEKNGGANISVAYSSSIHTPGTGFVQFAANGQWARTEQVGFPVAYIIRPNFNYCITLAGTVTTTPDNGTANGTATAVVTGGFPPFSFQWNDPLAQSTVNATGLTSGRTYTVSVSDARGCSLTLTTDTLSSNVSIDKQLAAGISAFELYPNPARESATLNIELANPENISIRLFDVSGRLVYQRAPGLVTSFSEALSFGSLAPGAYNLQISTSKGSVSRRLILE